MDIFSIRCITTMLCDYFRLTALFIITGLCQAVVAAPAPGYAGLMATYHDIQPQLSINAFSAPLYLQSSIGDNLAQGHIYAVLDHPYSSVAEQLSISERWCDITLMHINVKACNASGTDGSLLNLYVGRKYYQHPDNAYHIQYHYEVNNRASNYLDLQLQANKGPLGTRDYLIKVELIPVTDDTSFIHFSYSYQYGLAARMAMKAYLATLGRAKVGFGVHGYNTLGDPIYVSGMQGALERNTMRYFIAIRAHMDALSGGYDQRLQRWFDLSTRYERQLFEMGRDEYISIKQREYINHLALN